MKINLEIQKEHFKNHVATFYDYGNIKVLDFKEPDSIHYFIRFLFEEDHYRLHISGDLGQLTACNYKNMCYDKFSDFVNNPGYFKEKIACMTRNIYFYDYEKAKKDLKAQIRELDCLDDDEEIEYAIDDILDDLDEDRGFGSKAIERLYELDECYWEWMDEIGKEETGIIDLYMLAFKLAQEQLKEK